MRPIISYSIFESETSVYRKEKGQSILQFSQFLPLLIRGHYCVWRGYEMRLHYDTMAPQLPYWPAMRRMHEEGLVTLVACGQADPLCKSMLWRMLPVFTEEDAVVVCRDIDSVPMPRDRACVEEWLSSGKTVHCIHDNAAHSGIMGGTTSVHSKRFRELIGCQKWKEFVDKGADLDWSKHGVDQHLLNRLLPTFAADTLIHELHHKHDDMGPVEIREQIELAGAPTLGKWFPSLGPNQAANTNALCFIGGCTDPQQPIDHFNAIDFPELKQIRWCEAP